MHIYGLWRVPLVIMYDLALGFRPQHPSTGHVGWAAESSPGRLRRPEGEEVKDGHNPYQSDERVHVWGYSEQIKSITAGWEMDGGGLVIVQQARNLSDS
jgi:hypothetical protein